MEYGLRRSAWVEIDTRRIRQNFRMIRSLSGTGNIAAVLKADAYGHGAVNAARVLCEEGVPEIGVATIDEALKLRQAGVGCPVMLLSPIPRGAERYAIEYNLPPVISCLGDAEALSEAAVRAATVMGAYIKLETGMGRLGFMNDPSGLAAIEKLNRLPGLRVEGALSHFAGADAQDPAGALKQFAAFEEFCEKLQKAGVAPGRRSVANSAALLRFPQTHLDMVRPGIALYGHYPSPFSKCGGAVFQPAMSVKASIVMMKEVPPGFTVSYGSTFTTERESVIGVLPIGYADGLPRALSGKGRVIVRGRYAPIIGVICMDQCVIDLTEIPGARIGDEATVMGEDGDKSITADEIGEKAGTISYEILCGFGQRLPK
ncbi:MAG: alanine racemase, partial [Clostridiales bacterium]|nr:alanine racemase [Clostridiales bacterium]